LVFGTAGSSLWQHTLPFWERRSIEASQRIHDVIKAYRLRRARRQPHGGLRFDSTRVGCPGRQDRAFFFGAEVGVPYHILWVVERRCRVEKFLQVGVYLSPRWSVPDVAHVRPPSSSFFQIEASMKTTDKKHAKAKSSLFMGFLRQSLLSGRRKNLEKHKRISRGILLSKKDTYGGVYCRGMVRCFFVFGEGISALLTSRTGPSSITWNDRVLNARQRAVAMQQMDTRDKI
jgi:hypothetical protein